MRQSSIVSASVFTCSDSGKWHHSSLLPQSALLPQSKRVLGSNPSRISSWVCAFCVGSPGPLASSHSPKLTSGVNGCLSWICRRAWHGALGLAADSSQLHKVHFCLPLHLPRPKPPLILYPSLPLPLFSMTGHHLLTNVCPLQPSQFCCCVYPPLPVFCGVGGDGGGGISCISTALPSPLRAMERMGLKNR